MSSSALPRAADDAWWVVDENAAIHAVRRAAAALAAHLGFSADRIAEVGIVVTELATNLVRHAGGGELVLRVVEGDGERLLRVLAIDAGPGSRNIHALISDGASTRGTLGIGLGACMRLSSAFDVYSVPATGTIAEALLGARAAAGAVPGTAVSDLTRPLTGDGPCGDTTAHRMVRGQLLAMVADGLGHGPLAAEASRRAADILMTYDTTSPAALLERIDGALASTRGAAVAIVRYAPESSTLLHAGVGNVVMRMVEGDRMRTVPSQPGIVGHRSPRLRESSFVLGDSSTVVLHSDGLSQRWSLEDVPGVLDHHPAVTCAALVRAAASRRDDASVLVLRTAG